VPLSGITAAEAAAKRTAVYAGLDPLSPSVTAGKATVADDGKSATVPLELTWDVDDADQDWTYTTTAHLVLVEEQWQVQWSSFLLGPDLREAETLGFERVAAPRAGVLGAGGVPIVEPRPVQRLGLDKTHVDAAAQDAAARDIASALGIDPEAFATSVAAAGPKAFVEGLVVRTENPPLDVAAFTALPGATAVADTLPLAPTRQFARAVLGTAGPATAEIIEASQGAIRAGDTTGLSGLQRQYDEQLRGMPGLSVVATASDTQERRVLFHTEPTAGTPLATTLDPAWQQAAEAVLAPVVPAAGIVVIRPSTGEVLAAASGPGSEGYSTSTLGTYAPGSVFKVVGSLALLRAGLTPDSTVACPPTITVEGRVFNNFPDYPTARTGDIPLRTAVASSCNTAFIGQRDVVDQAALADAAAALGLGGTPDLGFPAFMGDVPTSADGTDHAASMIGQGRLQVSPLAMATVAASVAAGHPVVPWLVGSEPPAATAPAHPVTSAEAASLQALMRGVVTDGGAAFLADVPGGDVLAKTGTAQYSQDGELRNHAWMIAIQGDVAVAVLVADGDYGSTTAGPLLEQLLTAMAAA
jgi:cell division protein FtsI/penicillin-binding protein 2